MATTSVLERSEGGTFIPASQRPDGTWRKPRRIKEGYVPQEEVPLYESRGKQWAKSRAPYPVGLDPDLIKASEQKSSGKTNAGSSKKKKKTNSNQPVPNPGAFDDYDPPQQQQQQLAEKSAHQTIVNKSSGSKKHQESSKKDGTGNNGEKTFTDTVAIEQQQSTTEPSKRLRNLRKKLRDIENLEQKIKSKELKNPDKDQIEKVSRKEGVQAEILALELELSMKINTS